MSEEKNVNGLPDAHNDVYSKTIFGFWLYIITDFMLFATLFAAYAVLRHKTFGAITSKELFDIHFAMIQTVTILSLSFVIGMAGVFAHRRNKNMTILFFLISFVIGAVFAGMQFVEFSGYLQNNHSWKNSAFLSAFYTLTGTFLIHVLFGLLWILLFTIPVFFHGLTQESVKRLTCLKMFWQFLGIVWVFIFTIVYLIGAVT